MSRYFSNKYESLTPYTPGEQPQDMQYIKLNTNESPFPPSLRAQELAADAANSLQLYSDPECRELVNIASSVFGVNTDEIIFTNGSDEVLNFAFMAFCDDEHPAVFPNVTYGFYKVFAELNGIPYTEIPLKSDFTVNVSDYLNVNKTVFIANPNAPTGIALETAEIEEIIKSNPDNIVVIDEAYIDFADAESLKSEIFERKSLIILQTLSKAWAMAGLRVGLALADSCVIELMSQVKYPYNINVATMSIVSGLLAKGIDAEVVEIKAQRVLLAEALEGMSMVQRVYPSDANFVLVKVGDADAIYEHLIADGIIVRNRNRVRGCEGCLRITIGTKQENEKLIKSLERYE